MTARLWSAAALATLAVLPALLAGRLSLSIFVFIGFYSLIAIGLSLLAGQAGQVSLGQAAFYGVGAYIAAITTLRGLSPWLALPAAVAGAGALAFVLGAPIFVLRGHYLVLGTLGLNIVLDVVIRNAQSLTGGPTGLTGIPPLAVGPWTLAGDRAYYYVTWALVVLTLWLGRNLIRSRVGRALAAIRSSEVAAATLGISGTHYKSRVFALSGALAGAAGALYVHYLSFVSPSPFAFGFSIDLLVMSVLGGIAHLEGAVLGAVIVTVLREALRTVMPQVLGTGASAEYEIIVFGVLLALVVILAPAGVWPAVRTLFAPGRRAPAEGRHAAAKGGRAPAEGSSAARTAEAAAREIPPDAAFPSAAPPAAPAGRWGADAPPSPEPPDALLAVERLEKRFEGLLAVHGVTFAVRPGEIYAVIGPNGAGKTTVFNLISGVLRPTRGTVRFDGRPITHLPAHRTAALGIARTFQTPKVFADLTVLDNVMAGLHRTTRTGFLAAMAGLHRAEELRAREEATAYLALVGLEDRAAQRGGSLPFGAQRLLEIARALAARPRLLLLDEPASGLTAPERAALVELIRRIRAGGVTVLLVEHDVGLVMGLADRVLVLNYGEKIAEGPPGAVREDPRVVGAYLGEPEAAPLSEAPV